MRRCLRWEAQKTDFYIRHAMHSTYPRYRPPLDGTPATLTTPMGIPHWAVDPVGGSTAGTRLGSARPPPPAPLRAPARPRRSVRRGRGRGVTRPARGARGGGAGGMGGMRGGAERLREAGNGAWGGRGGEGGSRRPAASPPAAKGWRRPPHHALPRVNPSPSARCVAASSRSVTGRPS